MSRPSLLLLTQRLPYPPNKGEKVRSLQILRHLRRTHDVHLGCLVDDPADVQFIPILRELCADIHVASLDRRMARLMCLRGLLTGEALSVTFFRDRGLQDWVRRVLTEIRPEIVFVNSSNMAPYILDLPNAGVRIVDLADLDSEKWRAYAEIGRMPMRWVHRREWRKVAALERRIATECDLASFVSEAETRLFRTCHPDLSSKARSVSNGVDFHYFDPTLEHAAAYDTTVPNFVFTGTMDYPPNIDAVDWFARDVLPVIRRRHVRARFEIVGASPAPAVRALGALDGVHVTGRVPDVRPYLAHATAAVAPMRIARGIQNKVLEAMAMARPVIVTAGALEGIEATTGRDLLLADDTDALAAACCRMVTHPREATALGAAARRLVVEQYDWSVRLSRFDDFLCPRVAA